MRHMASAISRAKSNDVPEHEQRDIFAYLQLCLAEMDRTVDRTVEAWENRGYWVKADRFRLDWSWAAQGKRELGAALENENFELAIESIAGLASNLAGHEPYKKDLKSSPWLGSWDQWRSPS